MGRCARARARQATTEGTKYVSAEFAGVSESELCKGEALIWTRGFVELNAMLAVVVRVAPFASTCACARNTDI